MNAVIRLAPEHRGRASGSPPEPCVVSRAQARFAQEAELGTPLKEIAMGGATDGNFTAAIGGPTLDGMGPDGGLSHSEREFLELPSIRERMGILIRVIEHLSEKGLG